MVCENLGKLWYCTCYNDLHHCLLELLENCHTPLEHFQASDWLMCGGMCSSVDLIGWQDLEVVQVVGVVEQHQTSQAVEIMTGLLHSV